MAVPQAREKDGNCCAGKRLEGIWDVRSGKDRHDLTELSDDSVVVKRFTMAWNEEVSFDEGG